MQDKKQQPQTSPAAVRLAAGRQELIGRGNWSGFPSAYSGLVDRYFRERLTEVWTGEAGSPDKGPFALVAVGGYGRGEMCLFSDIDILVIYEKTLPPSALNLAQQLFFPLWDLGLELGHGFRGFSECVELARKDFQVLASLLDVRCLAGNREVFDRFLRRLESQVFEKRKLPFAEWLRTQSLDGLDQYGDASALLEPDIKNGLGGLRDYHRILWLLRLRHGPGSLADLAARGCISRSEAQALAEHNTFLLLLRNHLHSMSGRKSDRLFFEHQEEMARRMGFAPSAHILAVEAFLAALHRRLADIKALSAHFWTHAMKDDLPDGRSFSRQEVAPGVYRFGGELFFAARNGSPTPATAMAMFEEAAGSGLPLSWEARSRMPAAVRQAEASPPGGADAFAALMRILVAPHAFSALTQMLETGFLGAILPELGLVQDHMQFDAYHIFPVGRHSVATVGNLRSLDHNRDQHRDQSREHPEAAGLAESWRGLVHPERLLLAALLHDVGKGKGGDHCNKGADMVKDMLARFGADEQMTRDVAFLVRRHLFLAETASRLDLSEENVAFNCATVIGTEERLTMLNLLTWADSRATGPKAWNDWQASLRSELFYKVLRILRNDYSGGEDETQRIQRTRDIVRERAEQLFEPAMASELLENMPARYAMTRAPEEIVRHLELIDRLRQAVEEDKRMMTRGRGGQGVAAISPERDEDARCWQLTVAAPFSPAHFATVTGVLALHDVNILSAELFVWGDNTIVSILTVSDPPDDLFVDEVWTRVRRSYRYAMTGKLSLDFRLAEKRRSPLGQHSGPKNPGRKPGVRVDNTTSDFYSLIEVKADDRIGLLHDIAAALQNLQLEVHLAKISTNVDQAMDVFYVRDLEGQKIIEPNHVREIEQATLFAVSRT